MGPFNNREVATACWLLVFVAWALLRADVRKSAAGVVRSFLHYKILASICSTVLYVTASVALLSAVSFWKMALLKDTIWFCFAAIAMMTRVVTSADAKNVFHKVLLESVKVVILLEFLVNTYTFSIPAELVIVPLCTLIAMLDVVASSDRRFSAAAGLIRGLQGVLGFVILANAIGRAVGDMRHLGSLDTVRSILLAPLLSVILSPFLYGVLLYSSYEHVFLRLNLGVEKDKRLKRYARRRIMMHAGLRLKRVQDLLTNHAFDLMHIKTEADVDRLLRSSTDS